MSTFQACGEKKLLNPENHEADTFNTSAKDKNVNSVDLNNSLVTDSDSELVREQGKKLRKATSSRALRAKKKRAYEKDRVKKKQDQSTTNPSEDDYYNLADLFEENVMSVENEPSSMIDLSQRHQQTEPNFDGIDFSLDNLLDIQDDNFLSGSQICTFLALMCSYIQRVAYLDSYYLSGCAAGRNPPILNFMRIWLDHPQIIFCPINVNEYHWTLLVIDVLRKTATYYNTLKTEAQRKIINTDESSFCTLILDGLKNVALIDDSTSLVKAPADRFNQQDDGFNCGVHILYIAEEIASKGCSTKEPTINIRQERQRIKSVLAEAYAINKNLGTSRKENLPQWPNRNNYPSFINEEVNTIETSAEMKPIPPTSSKRARGRPRKSTSLISAKDDNKGSFENLTPSQELMPPPTSDTHQNNTKNASSRKNATLKETTEKPGKSLRRSTRLAEKLPNLVPLTDRCHYANQGHKNGCASRRVNHKVDYFDVGDFNKRCKNCGAWKNEYEMITPNVANKCCNHGDINTKELQETHDILENQIPNYLKTLQDPDFPDHKKFIKNSIGYNSIVAFGSISTDAIPPLATRGPPAVRLNGNFVHNASDLNPPEGKTRKFGQVYVVDLEEGEDAVEKNSKQFKLDDRISKLLMKMISETHVFAPLFKQGSEILAKAIEDAAAEGKEIPNFRLIIVDAREEKNFTAADPTIHPHRAEKPKNELIGMIWCNDDGEPPEYKGIWLNGRDGKTHYVPYYSSNIDALCYPLLFPHGTQLYHNSMPLNKTIKAEAQKQTKKEVMNEDVEVSDIEVERHINGSEDEDEEDEDMPINTAAVKGPKSREFASRRQVYRYHLYPRRKKNFKQDHWLWSKGPLADAFLIDIICRTERCALNAAKRKIQQSKKRFTTSKELRRYIEKTYLKGKKLGSLFTIPSSFKGGRKYMQKAYSDIMTIIDNTDLPAWFITFTGNPKWLEIVRNIRNGQNRSDVKCRVFMAKAQEFLDDLLKRNVMGKVQAYHAVMEFQKRGMPHLHVILIMEEKVTAEDVDSFISACIPDLPDPKDNSEAAKQQRRLHGVVVRNQIHLCNENSGCQVDGVCTKGYKKPFVLSTVIHSHKPAEYERLPPKPTISAEKQPPKNDLNTEQNKEDDIEEEEEIEYFDEQRKDFDISYVEYERRPPPPEGTEVTEKTEHLFGNTYMKKIGNGASIQIDNGHVVPYNPFLSLKYDCHINVECTVGQTGSPKYTCKYTTKLGDVVYAKVRKIKPGGKDDEPVEFDEGEQHICARIMTGCEAWMRLHNTWIIKQSHIVETLQIHLEGENMVVFEEGDESGAIEKEEKSHLLGDLKTVDGVMYLTFVQAAQKLGLWQDDEIHYKAIRDAFSAMRSSKQRRHYFAMVIAHNTIGKVDEFLDKFLDDLFLEYGEHPDSNRKERRLRALNYLEFIFQKTGTSCRRLGLTVPEDFEDIVNTKEAEVDFDEPDDPPVIDGHKVSSIQYAEAQRNELNNDQKAAFKRIWDAIEGKSTECFFFLQGSGGTGKTFLYNNLINYCKAHGKKVVACASTGIAATLLKNGMTAHSAFFIPNDIDHETAPKITAQSNKGQWLQDVELIIIDEVSMLHKNLLKYIDRTLQELKGNRYLFGGAVVLIGGDWKQLTPVIPKAYPNEVIDASVKKWDKFIENAVQLNLFENMRVKENELIFIEDLKLIGNGSKSRFLPGSNSITLNQTNIAINEKELIDFCYEPEWLTNPHGHIEKLCGSAILCPTNTVVYRMNGDIMSRLEGAEKVYESIDTPLHDNDVAPFNGDISDYSLETMHNIQTAGLPPHELIIKKGAIVMLIKNLSIFTGLCNGTRMQIIDMNDDNLICKIVSGSRSQNSEPVFISRCTFQYGGTLSEPGIRFTRCQFPVKLSFAMTINKAQGQTLDRVGLYFRQGECFSHGQLYTAMSR
uniref:ATP-dependent DNA helicase n=1 Tax=Panagrolaimus sp. ES5 TaxID=591445 RepID=A0AC34FHG3_9BILA